MRTNDTIFAVGTGTGVPHSLGGASDQRVLVRVSGVGVPHLVAGLIKGQRPNRGAFCSRLGINGSDLPAISCVSTGPATYTGEDTVEFLLPGPGVADLLLSALAATDGCRHAQPGEFTARAYLNGRMSLAQAEGIGALLAARSEQEREAARSLIAGEVGARVKAWTDIIARLLALVEAGIDFTDQEDVTAINSLELREEVALVASQITKHLGAEGGRHLIEARPLAVLVGRPNAGKSTLFNALLGRERSVVSDLAGTTRDCLREELDLKPEIPAAGVVMLCDVPGVGGDGPKNALEDRAVVADAVGEADVVIHCDPAGVFDADVRTGARSGASVILVRTKADMACSAAAEPALDVCALDGWHMAQLRGALAEAAFGAAATAPRAIPGRHRLALESALAALCEVLTHLDEGGRGGQISQPEVVAAMLHDALEHAGSINGRVTTEDLLGRIFSTFCIGK